VSILSHGLLLMSLLNSVLDEGPATEIRYNGTLTPTGRNSDGFASKQFDIFCLVVNRDGGRDLAFLVDEAGGGGWSWPERFGVIALNQSNRATNGTRVRLLHSHEGSVFPVTVRSPLFEFGDKLKVGADWKDGKQAYEVLRTRKFKSRDCWVVDVSNNFGHQQTLFVEKESHLIISAEQRITMGRGDRFSLKYELESVKSIDKETLSAMQQPLQTIIKLKETLNRSKDQETKPELNDAQLEAASAVIDRLTVESAKTPFDRYAKIIRRNIASQKQRVSGVAGLAKRFVGTQSPQLALKTLTGGTIAPKDYAGKIVVLHFWEYRNKPLVEPYGQVGYLDFLNNKNIKRRLDVKTYGVAVDKRFADASQRSAAVRSVRQLREFFNLGYPVLLDDGTLLGKFGDPRRLDAKLPLWVVIGPDGKIAHYSTGFYNIKPDKGLQQLEAVIVDLVKQQRTDEK
jgi:peroxiredoxin